MEQEHLDPISRLALQVFRAQQSLVSVGDDLTSQWGLTSAKWKVLGAVDLSDSPPTASGIGRTMGMTRQAATKQIGLLVEHGLLIPHDNPTDARAAVYTLSQDGKATYDAISAAWAERVSAIRASIDDAAIAGALTALTQLVAGIEQLRTSPAHRASHTQRKGIRK